MGVFNCLDSTLAFFIALPNLGEVGKVWTCDKWVPLMRSLLKIFKNFRGSLGPPFSSKFYSAFFIALLNFGEFGKVWTCDKWVPLMRLLSKNLN